MLTRLSISNYAIIDELEVQFENGFNIITGETGAGKSILVGALNLVLGERADSGVLYHKEKKCIVEARFMVEGNAHLKHFFADNDLDEENEVVLRREISATGKSRSFINDTPANLGQLRALSKLLVDLHQQFDTLDLDKDEFQREVIDAFAGNKDELMKLQVSYAEYAAGRKTLNNLLAQQEAAGKEFDYNRFQLDELEKYSFVENEIEQLEVELKLLSNADHISQQLDAVVYALEDAEQPVLGQLKSVQQKVQNLAVMVSEMDGLARRISESIIELKDTSQEINHIRHKIQSNPGRMAEVEERLSAGFKLLRKHNVASTSELLQIQKAITEKLESVTNLESEMADLEKQQAKAFAKALRLAENISKKRKAQLAPFAQKVNALLKQVGMPNAALMVELENKALAENGIDRISFLFDANKSGHAEPIGKVASGGELSRLMLCIKSLVAQQLALPTLIFDEIDSGISGEAAKQVSEIMLRLSGNHQLISITHQPQIAARAGTHYFVFKETRNNRVVTGIKALSPAERVVAIAKMLGGEKPSAIALENAREMINQ